MLSKIPLPVFTVGVALLTVASLFAKAHLSHAGAVTFVVVWLGWCVLTAVRLGQSVRAMRRRPAS